MPLVFESRATGPVLMTDAPARSLLAALGRAHPDGHIDDQGVLTVEQLPELIVKLEGLIEASKRQAQAEAQSAAAQGRDHIENQAAAIDMHQRAWPLLDQCRRALAAEKPVTWRKG